MSRGRKPKAVVAVELLAVELWRMPEGCDPALWWRRIAAEFFGMGAMLRNLGHEAAALLAYWLAALAEHLAYGDLPLPVQSDLCEGA